MLYQGYHNQISTICVVYIWTMNPKYMVRLLCVEGLLWKDKTCPAHT